jgi:proteasome lid subunit RPN8/RPN11
MSDEHPQQEEPIDVRVLAREKLTHEAFPGGRNEGLRVFFTPQVHEALWRHAALDTTVEICGVLVGTWYRDQAGPFVKIVESIRGEGAETRFAEVTFTHQTWAKINAEMDTKFSKLLIVGWYHTHPDFGIFLSDRDRFIHEHFFSGPGQIAHVMDPIRKTEGVFIWRSGKPSLCEHFWVGERILTQFPGRFDQSSELEPGGRSEIAAMAARLRGSPLAMSKAAEPVGRVRELLPAPVRWIAYAILFILGYLLASILSAWEHQRFVESVLASNGFIAVLRLGLADELDELRGDLAGIARPLEALSSKTEKPEEQLAEIRTQVVTALRRTEAIKARYGNTSAEDEMLKRMLRDRLMAQQRNRSPEISNPAPSPTKDAVKGDGKTEASTENANPKS